MSNLEMPSLPDDLWLKILDYVDGNLLDFCCTSKRFFHLAGPKLYENPPKKAFETILLSNTNYGNWVKRLYFNQDFVHIPNLLIRCPNLTCLALPKLPWQSEKKLVLKNIILKMKKLQSLKLILDTDFYFDLFELSNLKYLDEIIFSGSDNAKIYCSRKCVLNVSKVQFSFLCMDTLFFESFVNLKTLSLRCILDFKPQSTSFLPLVSGKLESLSMVEMPLDEQIFTESLPKFKNLRKLCLNCVPFSPLFLKNLAKVKLKHLQELEFFGSQFPEIQMLDFVSKATPTLKLIRYTSQDKFRFRLRLPMDQTSMITYERL